MADDDETPPPPYVLYKDRPDWSDVVPIPQDDGFQPVAPILYSEKYKDATSYFRAIHKSGEKSERVLDLTLQIIKFNPSHYTVWLYRYATLLALNSSLQAELSVLSLLLPTHMKSYQAWNHRRLLLLQLGKGSARSELAFTAVALERDAKNYHTWVYREWLLCTFFSPSGREEKIRDEDEATDDDKVWEAEVEWTESMLDDDVRNNSVWHHRFFVLFEGPNAGGKSDLAAREIDFTKKRIALAPNNASAWNYFRGVLQHSQTPFTSALSFAEPFALPQSEQPESISSEEAEYLPGRRADLPCNLALEFIADCYGEGGQGEKVKHALELYDILIERDPIRKRYWEFRKRSVQKPQSVAAPAAAPVPVVA